MENINGKADIHIHTIFSDGLMSPEALVEYVVLRTDLNVIAVTDHDTIAGALVAQAYANFFRERFRTIDVIIGTEVTSADGDILALFVENDIRPGLSAEKTVAAIHEQGGLAIAAHPYSHAPFLLRMDGMKGVKHLIETIPFDGVEIRNGTPTELISNHVAARNNRRAKYIAETGGSDGHYLPSIGKTYTRFPGSTAEDLRHAVLNRTTQGAGRIYSPFLIFNLIYDLLSQRLPARCLPIERSYMWPLSQPAPTA